MLVPGESSKDVEREEALQEQCESDQDTRNKLIETIGAQVKDVYTRVDLLRARTRLRENRMRIERRLLERQLEAHKYRWKASLTKRENESLAYKKLKKQNEALISENNSLLLQRDSFEASLRNKYDGLRVEDQRANLMTAQLASENCKIYKQSSAEMHEKILDLYSQIKDLINKNMELQNELKDENTHHRIAVSQVTTLNQELDSRNSHYDEVFAEKHTLNDKYRHALQKLEKMDASMKELEKSYAAAKVHIAKSYEALKQACAKRDQFEEENVKHLDRSARQTDAIKRLFIEKENSRIEMLKKSLESVVFRMQIPGLKRRIRELEQALVKSETQHDAALSKLESALEEKQEALRGQLEALKMVDSSSRWEITFNDQESRGFGDEDVRIDVGAADQHETSIGETEQDDEEKVEFYDCVEQFP